MNNINDLPTVPTANNTFRRDLIARIYCEMINNRGTYGADPKELSAYAIDYADTLIEAMEASND